MNRLVISNLLHRPLRSAISILAVAIEVAMILSIVGILFGQIEGSRRQQSGIGADLIVRPPNAKLHCRGERRTHSRQGGRRSAQTATHRGGVAGNPAAIREKQCRDGLGH